MTSLPKEYGWGQFNASLAALSGSVQLASSSANYALRAARSCQSLTGADVEGLLDEASRLEAAAATLRAAATLAKPQDAVTYLQAAE